MVGSMDMRFVNRNAMAGEKVLYAWHAVANATMRATEIRFNSLPMSLREVPDAIYAPSQQVAE